LEPLSFFLIPSFPLFHKKEKKIVFLVGDARCHRLHLRAAGHGPVDNTLGKLSLSLFLFFTVKCTLDWQSLSREGEIPGLKSII